MPSASGAAGPHRHAPPNGHGVWAGRGRPPPHRPSRWHGLRAACLRQSLLPTSGRPANMRRSLGCDRLSRRSQPMPPSSAPMRGAPPPAPPKSPTKRQDGLHRVRLTVAPPAPHEGAAPGGRTRTATHARRAPNKIQLLGKKRCTAHRTGRGGTVVISLHFAPQSSRRTT